MFNGRRSLKNVLLAPLRRDHYAAALRSFAVYDRPFNRLYDYVTSSGVYPQTIALKTPAGPIQARLHTAHDLRTVNEVFCRVDYPTPPEAKVIVDFGSNIGISALYFLTHALQCVCHLYEPLAANIEKLRENVQPFAARVRVNPIAVGLEDGMLEFGYEPTGRYGGLGLASATQLLVPCRRAVDVIDEILASNPVIDILKVDIESLEKALLASLREDQLRRIRTIYVEQTYASNPFPTGIYRFRQRLSIAEFTAITR